MIKNIKLIIADMDGTLLDDDHRINNGLWEQLQIMKRRKILFAVASGRQYFNLLEKFRSVKDDIVFIAENGSYVVYRDKEIFSDVMNSETVARIVGDAVSRPGVSITLCGKKSSYVDRKDPEFIPFVRKYYDRVEIVEDLTKVEDDILKISICEHNGVKDSTVEYFRKEGSDFKVTASTEIWIDIANRTANKGEAVEIVQKKLEISREETVVFGDYLNDIEMIENAGLSFAMKNGHSEVKKIADYIIGSNNENSVVEKIKELLADYS